MIHNFKDLGIKSLFINTLEKLNISKPSKIQQKSIPFLLESNKDLVALAQTGSGKTLAFGLPLLQKTEVDSTHIQSLILAPTRELGQQIYSDLSSYCSHEETIKIASFFGGATLKSQKENLKVQPQVIVATPGRLLDLIEKKEIDLSQLKHLVLDEADEMLNSFKDQIVEIIKHSNKKRRMLLFTATWSSQVKQIVNDYLSKDVETIEISAEKKSPDTISHQFVVVEPIEKLEVLMHFLSSKDGAQGIIFCKTKAAVNKLAKNLAKHKFSSGALHGSLSQGIRDRIMGQFRDGHLNILVATDLAARGLDVKDLGYVVNYHLPDTYDNYIHRTGRTARAGAKGLALTVLQQEEVFEIPEFEEELNIKFEQYIKADAKSIEDNNTLLWAKKIFKTKPNRGVSEDLKAQIKTIFHHLTKEELVDKVLAHYLNEMNSKNYKK
jgi:ATP-dependent RNA helicase DeaD